MNEDVIKPFPCKECVMSFFTDDHLTAHYQAKHGKLNLEIPKEPNAIFADQTPTPTRLLNNCEELRVFDDLQNINPFDEGFRRAVEEPLCQDTFLPSNQDTLHTPQILFKSSDLKTEKQDEPENLSLEISRTAESNIPKTTQSSCESPVDTKSKTAQVPITILPKPSIIYAAPILSTQTTLHLNQSNDNGKTNESVKHKLKNILLSNSGSQIVKKRVKLESDAIPSILLGALPSLVTAPSSLTSNKFLLATSNVQPVNGEESKPSEAANVPRKKSRGDKTESASLKIERNRAAARRYRTKMKIQSQALQEKFDKSQKEIAALKKELTDLKKELTQVKAILLLHKDCPVAKPQLDL